MTTTIKLKKPTDKDLVGFINIITDSGYAVRFRKGSKMNLMADITDDEKIGRDWASETESKKGK